MNYVSILNQLLDAKIIAILRLDSPEKAQRGIEALKKIFPLICASVSGGYILLDFPQI